MMGAADVGKAMNQVDLADPVEAADWRAALSHLN
jgi:hypothetical protein